MSNEGKNDEFEELNPEERLNWLRERGVQIETVEERRKKVTDSKSQSVAKGSDHELISYVQIPCDESKPMKELLLPRKIQLSDGDLLPDHLKPFFGGDNSKGEVDLALLQEQAKMMHLATEDAPKPSEETMKKVASQGAVETFTLVKPVKANGYVSINIYLDEVGMLKRLPLNPRATEYAKQAGFNPPPIFYGDIFIGRVANKPVLKNIDFKLGPDTSYDAPWLRNATMENLEFQTAMNSITGRADVQPSADGEDGISKEEEGYSWTQTEDEIEIIVSIPKSASLKEVNATFHSKSLKVMVKNQNRLHIEFFAPIDPDGSTWTLEADGADKRLVVTCEKRDPMSWPRISH